MAALSGTRAEVVVVDPDTRRLVARHRVAGVVSRASRSRGGLVLLVAPPDRLGPATLAVATPRMLRTVELPLEIGVDPPAVAEPGLAVSPDGRRAVVVGRGNHLLEVDLHSLAVTERELAEPVSLLGQLRSWLEPAARAKGPLDGPVRSAAWVGRDRVVVAGWNYRPTGERTMIAAAAGVTVIDTRDWSVRTVAGDASAAVVAGDTILAFGGTHGPTGLRGVGVQGFGADGRRRFHLFGNRFVGSVRAVGRYAYVSQQSEAETRIDVVDVTSGRLVRTVRKQTYMDVLQVD